MTKMKRESKFKVGKVALIGRPNAGKSTLLNNIVGQKVAIVSDKPQTTQSKITAVYEDLQGQIFFKDTPGFFESKLGIKKGKSIIKETITDCDILLYVVDHTRKWGIEEEEIANLAINSGKPIFLVINKIDIETPNNKQFYLDRFKFAAKKSFEVSSLKLIGIKDLINNLFEVLPEGSRDFSVDDHVSPLLSQNSKEYLAELVREKIFLLTSQEVPYQVSVLITSVVNNDIRNILKVKGKIEMSEEKYKAMIIGKNGNMIKKIMKEVRKELENLSNKKVFVELKVV